MSYEVVARIARGGMGVVDLGVDDTGNQVALKRLTLWGSASEMASARQRLHREAEVLTQLDHPAIVELVDIIDDGGEVVLVMPYLSGGTLTERVTRSGPLPGPEISDLAHTMLGALAAAHRAGVVHRDVKPGNVLFDDGGRPKLADFGVATTREGTPGLTATGMVVGTPGYLSPEQARGEAATPASDVFSLGATLFFAATGEGPFGAGDPRVVLYRSAKDRVAAIPRHLDPELRRMLGRMLDPRPSRRPSAAELAAGPEGTMILPSPARRRRWFWPALAGGAVAILVLGRLLVLADDDKGREGADDAEPGSATTECAPQKYLPCGGVVAPNTDGTRCIEDHDDYDGDVANGCEAAPDEVDDGTELTETIEANLVPRDDVDSFVTIVDDDRQLLCDGRLTLALTAPSGVSLRLEVLDSDGDVVAETVSGDGLTSEVKVDESSCGGDDSATLTLRVNSVGSDRTGDSYVLTRRGGF